ncbi:hypothetical protein DSO57_1012513 [Entomophthora muscae]|uniref:Uncharacterized protein n=1 Tax=Entomophthora muscae TaxID=34485 RepID=A0ACC2U4H2_9FUNG|nr:hypothetical protein DSO57_1012513 [Entomophthora muscae]
MTPRGKEFLEKEFKRLFQDWHQPNKETTPAEVMLYGGDSRMVIGKILEEFTILQAKYNLLAKESPHLENENPTVVNWAWLTSLS